MPESKALARFGVLFALCLAFLTPALVRSVQAAPVIWSIETVDRAASVGHYTSLALDSNGYPHIGHYDVYCDDLKYARWTGSAWSLEPVDTVGDVGLYTSIALDSSDHPHISYYDLTNSPLKYARAPDEHFSDVTYTRFDSNACMYSRSISRFHKEYDTCQLIRDTMEDEP